MEGGNDGNAMKMKQITQHEAESLIRQAQLLSSTIERKKGKMMVVLTFKNDRKFIMSYDLANHMKHYFVVE